MSNVLTSLEVDLRWLGALAGLGALGYAIYRILRAQNKPVGHQTGSAHKILRTRYLVIATLVFCLLAVFLWKPLPVQLPIGVQLVVSIIGAGVYFFSIGLYLWGLNALGQNFNASSGFGVRLHQAHQLITTGPYAYIRHPMYVGVILACWGGLLLYRTWTMLFFAIMMCGLIYRARTEEQALAQVFAETWHNYIRQVPAFIPRLKLDKPRKRVKRPPRGKQNEK
jgi:protein-S-isoprenylcysteine O-methyltransferase Ste14